MNFEPNEMMMDLFRSEVESHSETLNDSLLLLEREPADTSVYEGMMRAAHSIKGAARIVRVAAAVDVAHVMEDCFVAAQRGELTIYPNDFDLLLKSVDLLLRISDATRSSDAPWDLIAQEVKSCVQSLAQIRQGLTTERSAKEGKELSANHLIAQVGTNAPISNHSDSNSTASSSSALSSTALMQAGPILDRSRAEALRLELLRYLEQGIVDLRIDLSQTKELDSIGLAFLAAAQNHVAGISAATLRYDPLSEEIALALRVTGIRDS